MNRNEILSSLQEDPHVSVLIVGGGINGIGTFRDLALNGVDVLLVDNLTADEVREAVRRAAGRAKTEISGGVTLDRMADGYATVLSAAARR